jgi:hypothetical protein
MYIDLYFYILLRKMTIVESSYGIHNNTNCTRSKFVGTFTTFPCKLYWSCPFNWKIWANARWGAVTHSYIVLSIETRKWEGVQNEEEFWSHEIKEDQCKPTSTYDVKHIKEYFNWF